MSDTSTPEPIIGQEAITPDGLGRVSFFTDGVVMVKFHLRQPNPIGECCTYSRCQVELIDPRGPRPAPPLPMTMAVSRSEADDVCPGIYPGLLPQFKVGAATASNHIEKIPDSPTTAHGEGFRIALAQVQSWCVERKKVADDWPNKDAISPGAVSLVMDDILEWLDDLAEDGS